ncbi:ligand-binding sensor domain-containing protein [Thalassotalea fusca]
MSSLSDVYQIVEGNDGYIWLAGQRGLMRYDDNELIHFSSASIDSNVPFIWINDIALYQDSLLISTENNLLWEFNTRTSKASKLPINVGDINIYTAIKHNDYYIFESRDEKSIYTFDSQKTQTSLCCQTQTGVVFLQTSEHIYFYNRQGLHLFDLQTNSSSPIFSQDVKAALVIENRIFALTHDAIHIFEGNALIAKHPISPNTVTIAAANDNQSIFALSENGNIKRLSLSLNELEHSYPHTKLNSIIKVLHDSSDALWVLTSSGIERLTETSITHHPFDVDIASQSIRSFIFQNSVLLTSFGAGLHSLNANQEKISQLVNQQLSENGLYIFDSVEVNGGIYIATFDGLWFYDEINETTTKVPVETDNQVFLKLYKHKHLLYIATDNDGFFIYDWRQKQVVLHKDKSAPFSAAEVIDILPLVNGDIWLATSKGVDVYNRATDQITTVFDSTSSKVLSLALADDKIFAATQGNGIQVFNLNKERLFQFATGINFSYIRSNAGEIWAPSRQGLFRIDAKNYNIQMVSGTQDYSFTGEPVFLNKRVYLAHYSGVLSLPLNRDSSFESPIKISKTTVSGKSYLNNRSIFIESSNDVVQLQLASLDYRDGQPKKFQYKINNHSWNQINGNQLTLTGLAPGKYDLSIMGTNSMGQWSKYRAYTEIEVAYPWYWTVHARIIYLTLLISTITFIVYLLFLRGRSIHHIHTLLAQDIKSKGKSALNTSRNLQYCLDLLEQQPLAKQLKRYDEISRIIRESINELSTKTDTNEPTRLLGKDLSVALPYLARFIKKKYYVKLTYNIDFDEDALNYEIQSDVYRIIYEALTSAILNGEGRNYHVAMQIFKQKLWLTLSDDTKSFVSFNNKIHFDMSIYYVRQIANKYNASVNTFEDKAQGSQLVISFPLMNVEASSVKMQY